ncbi:hypothetical protein CDIK_0890 [Cucumispora dikerogammari]|nr:hypothetical protein CDIK_0890 [Cucumispora dikerogammari]
MLIKTHLITNNILNTQLENNLTKISIHTYFICNYTERFNKQKYVIRGNKVFPKKYIKNPTNYLIKVEFKNKPSLKNITELKTLYPTVFDIKYINEFNFLIYRKTMKDWWHESVKYILSIDIIESEDSYMDEDDEVIKIHKLLL